MTDLFFNKANILWVYLNYNHVRGKVSVTYQLIIWSLFAWQSVFKAEVKKCKILKTKTNKQTKNQ